MSKPVLSGRLARRYLQPQQFEIIYVPKKAVKGQILADFLADHPLPVEWELCNDLPYKYVMNVEIRPPWKMYFDDMLPYSFTLRQRCSNNVVEYQALILGLEIATELNIPQLEVYGDSQSIINQLTREYEVRKPEKMNKQEDVLAGLASSIAYPGKEVTILVCEKWVTPPVFELQECETDDEQKVMVTATVDGAPDD
ncbi:hypothetical protein LIER_12780 [Lithospermum erythrorhizon]|uniref:RNase H type-1 domain-containing protein n=1 Tax=Lithospermum erythrorhizon TaxID=34254 RepID=A0AAV3PXJ5_LITER